MILEFGFQQHLDKEVFDLARMNVEQCLSLLAEEKSLLNLLESLTSHSTPLYSHSMGVALVSCLIGRAMGWESSPLFFRVVTGSILHDIGKKDFPLELQEKISSQMNAEELALWRSHPELGAKLLGEIEGLPAEIVQIVMHHHEVADGSGFPAGITGSKIHPVAKLIAVADEFFKLYRGQPALTPVEAIRVMEKGNRAPGVSGARWENLPALRTAFKL
jgi:putative nucleotidyltransferase with HDIG domain